MCCAGVQLNLNNPDNDPVDVSVLVDGTLHPANQVVRSGSFLYIMGLQAGTEYYFNITLTNIFGTAWINTTVKPLLEMVQAVSCLPACCMALVNTSFSLSSPPPQATPPPHK